MKLIFKIIKFFLIIFIVFITLVFYEIMFKKQNVVNKTLYISKNENIRSIYKELNLIYNIQDKIYFYLTEEDRYIKAGNIKFIENITKYQIIQMLKNPKYNNVSLTIPEGFTSNQVIDRIVSLNLSTREEILKAMSEYDFYYLHNDIFEGYLYPDTYYFSENESAKEIVDKILKEFLKNYPPEKYDKEKFYDTIKLASIIEKEIDVENEKKYISSVFHNRLKNNMMLQSDASILYVLDKKLSKKDLLENDTLYNTYKHLGLPPSPISNPSKKSIEASLNPAETDYLYFFTHNKKTYYSKTHKQHLIKRKESGQIK